MLNKYPLWKNLLVLSIVCLGLLYAMPNLYPSDPALQISPESYEVAMEDSAKELVEATLKAGSISVKQIEPSDTGLLVRLNDRNQQLRAMKLISGELFKASNSKTLAYNYVVALDMAATTPEWLVGVGASPLTLGLDLSGGVHFLLEVDMQKAVETRLRSQEKAIKKELRAERIRYRGVDSADGEYVEVKLATEDQRLQSRRLLAELMNNYVLQERQKDNAFYLRYTLKEQARKDIEDVAIKQNLTSLRNRVNELGVSEPLVQRLGANRIVVDLPGVQDPKRARDIIGKVATLQFHLEAGTEDAGSRTISFPQKKQYGRAVLQRDMITSGEHVIGAIPGMDENNRPQVNIELDSVGGEQMVEFTRSNIGRRMGIVYVEQKTRTAYEIVTDSQGVETETLLRSSEEVKEVISLATIQAVLGNRFRITGLDANEAQDLALLLRAGALAAPMVIVEERTVGPSLGQENIDLGRNSVIVGLALVLIFMLVYYRAFGLAANVALAANLVLLLAIMSMLGFTLTLPGIAGIVLTVGMAVDANVLIFSRIREELASGNTPQSAISAGFDRAFTTILDANITTLLVAVILFIVGTGAIKGFAVTLSIGIITSIFTAIMGTRAIVNLIYGGRNLKSLSV